MLGTLFGIELDAFGASVVQADKNNATGIKPGATHRANFPG